MSNNHSLQPILEKENLNSNQPGAAWFPSVSAAHHCCGIPTSLIGYMNLIEFKRRWVFCWAEISDRSDRKTVKIGLLLPQTNTVLVSGYRLTFLFARKKNFPVYIFIYTKVFNSNYVYAFTATVTFLLPLTRNRHHSWKAESSEEDFWKEFLVGKFPTKEMVGC